jgi:alpha-glucosidase
MDRAIWCAAGVLCLVPVVASAAPETPIKLTSPDGSIVVTLTAGGAVRYSVARHGELVLSPSPLGFIANDPQTGAGVALTPSAIGAVERSSVDRVLPVIAGKTARARDHFNEITVTLSNAGQPRATMQLIVRAYDDGIALRYRLPAGPAIDLRSEQTGFFFPGDAQCWGDNIGRFTGSHEGEFDPVRAAMIRPHHLYDTGLLCRTPDARTNLLFAEADLNGFPGMGLRGRGDGGGVAVALSPYPDSPRTVLRVPTDSLIVTPWRVVLMSDRAGDLIASNTIGNLNPAPSGDWSWVQPGKAAWDWWSGPYFPDIPAKPMNMTALKRMVDFAGTAGLPYLLVDEGWAYKSGIGGSTPADTDITRSQPDLDIPALADYAKAKGVRLMLWLQWAQLDARMDEALDRYAAWGIAGIKVDFMDRNDAAMVDFYHRLLKAAAQRHLLVNLHGAYQPTGLARTYPNYVTQEGVMGAEYNKGSRRITATHNVSLAFTRLVLGPMDYTPGGFRNRTPAEFQVARVAPQVQTTRGQALAMYVVYESPLQMVADSPDVYAGVPEFAFIRDVPTTWDETRFLGGDIGSHVVLARRKGRDWYIGAMNSEAPRDVTVPLGFLGAGGFEAEIWSDGARADQVVRSARSVRAGDSVALHLAGSGGAVIRLRPSPDPAQPRKR